MGQPSAASSAGTMAVAGVLPKAPKVSCRADDFISSNVLMPVPERTYSTELTAPGLPI
jgi:hypothetical protein